MIDRLLLTAGLTVLGIGLYILARSAHLGSIRRRLGDSVQQMTPGLAAFRPGQPALLYFTTPNCVPCRTVIKPGLRRLRDELQNRFQVLEVNAEAEQEATQYWKVMSVPTIFVLDPEGRPQHVHYGVVKPEVLRAELGDWLTRIS